MLNTITIQGRITRDPELRKTMNGKSITNITLACEREFKDANGNKETDFIEVIAWGVSAEYATKYLRKGDMAIATGRLQIDKYQDKNGNNREKAKINASNVYGMGRRETNTTYNGQTNAYAGQTNYQPYQEQPAYEPEYGEYDQLDIPAEELPF